MYHKYYTLLNVKISVTDYESSLKCISHWVRERQRKFVCVAAVHLVMECQKDKRLQDGVNRAGLMTPDGMPLVWLARFYGYRKVSRVYGPTLMQKLCHLAEKNGFKIFLLGGTRGQTERLKEKLLLCYPTLNIMGTQDTPARPIPPHDTQKINQKINLLDPDIVFVGLGCPHQERWMIENRPHLKAPLLVGVGAAFDFLSGDRRQAPLWIQNSGVEWLFRLLQEPKRLWYRYTVLNILFITLVFSSVLRVIVRKNLSVIRNIVLRKMKIKKLFLHVLLIAFIVISLEVGLRIKHTVSQGKNRYLSTSFETYALSLASEAIQKAAAHQKVSIVYKPYVLWGSQPQQFTESVSINSLGLRNKEISIEKDTNVFRIILLGGSTAWGYGSTSNGTTIAGYLEQNLQNQDTSRKYEVINFTQFGYNSTQEFIQWNDITSYKPNLVIHFTGYNDIYTGFLKRPAGWNHPFIQESILTANHWRAITTLLGSEVTDFLNKSYLFRALIFKLNRKSSLPSCQKFTDMKNIINIFSRNVTSITQIASAENIPVLFILQPHLFVEEKPLSPIEQHLVEVFKQNYSDCDDPVKYFKDGYMQQNSALQKLTQTFPKTFNYIDGRDFFKHTFTSIYFDIVHYSDFGNSIVAAEIARIIQSNLFDLDI